MQAIQTIGKEATIQFDERKSTFIGYIKPVTTVQAAEEFIQSIKTKHPDATHNVPLYRVVVDGNEHLKYNDDGEPSGTAGKPMAEIANFIGVYNFALVATRYFGGVKLGAGGLIRMYAKTAKLAFEEAGVIPPVYTTTYTINYPYNMTSQMDTFLHEHEIEPISADYTDTVTITIVVEKELESVVEEIYGAKIDKHNS